MKKETTGQLIYKPNNPVRIVTAASLFDGHDAAINIMRRLIQNTGAEVIHLGHNRSVQEVVRCAIEEDAIAIAMTSYQGGHVEYLQYMRDLLNQSQAGHIRIFAGGGGTILPHEIEMLHNYGISRVYTPDDGRNLGLQGMINHLVKICDQAAEQRMEDLQKQISSDQIESFFAAIEQKNSNVLASAISILENKPDLSGILMSWIKDKHKLNQCPVLGITGPGGAGKSSLTDEIIRRLAFHLGDLKVAVLSVDPSKRKSKGALLGDRIRMNALQYGHVFMRSMATRQSNLSLSRHVPGAIEILRYAKYDLIILESSGIGQSDSEIVDLVDIALYVMTPEYGAPTQLEKIDMLDFAHIIAINKFDKQGSQDALFDVRKQYRRLHSLGSHDQDLPIFPTIASRFNDQGMNYLFAHLINLLKEKYNLPWHLKIVPIPKELNDGLANDNDNRHIIPAHRSRYLAEISDIIHNHKSWIAKQVNYADKLYALDITNAMLQSVDEEKISSKERQPHLEIWLQQMSDNLSAKLDPQSKKMLDEWDDLSQKYNQPDYTYQVRDKLVKIAIQKKTLSGSIIAKVQLPAFKSWAERLRWLWHENIPGCFPYTAGVFPFKREGEEPTRMFAGEGGPERTNKRFHYLAKDSTAKRLSTAFDSVTLYGEDPDRRPDIYGKVGNSGVSVCTLDDAKKLYSGFRLCDPLTSVSMTINGPAPAMVSFFINAAIDQECEIYIRQQGLESRLEKTLRNKYDNRGINRPQYTGQLPATHDRLGLAMLGIGGDEVLEADCYHAIKKDTLSKIRGTVQADILKEDQAQNTCIYSTEFALRLMADMQQYFITNQIRNFYSVSISGYHIAEAGANPISQLAFTLANGFTYIEYYLSRGMAIDDFAPNFSFFFSNGLEAEYAVIGRVARRIWSRALRYKYGANARSQMLKYHIQTSGRSLHAQEIDFNDIRTTLQALYAIYDNCNSLHTNAYDEAITTPTEESVRRAMAIQLIINRELGLVQNENVLQGCFIIESLTDLVEEAVLSEFIRISDRGGVLGAMEYMYQRNKIQEESMLYENGKHSGELPIIGVNTFLSEKGSPSIIPNQIIRAENQEKDSQIDNLSIFKKSHGEQSTIALEALKKSAASSNNLFEPLIQAAKSCSLGQITAALYQMGGQYRRNI